MGVDAAVLAQTLWRLALKHDCDKAIDHQYLSLYSELLSPYGDRPFRMLEIGTGGDADPLAGGASAFLWADALPTASIVMVDLNPKTFPMPPSVTFVQADQSDPEQMRALARQHGPFDIIIDDGSHLNSHVLSTFTVLFPHLTPRGHYVIEDTQTSFLDAYGGSVAADAPTMASLMRMLVDAVNLPEIRELDGRRLPAPFGQIGRLTIEHNIAVITRTDVPAYTNMTLEGQSRMLAAFEALGLPFDEPGHFTRHARYLRAVGRLDDAAAVLAAGLAAFPGQRSLVQAQAALTAARPADTAAPQETAPDASPQ